MKNFNDDNSRFAESPPAATPVKFTDIFIKRPVLATVVNLFILLAGWQALQGLNVRQYPDVKNAVVTVTTAYPGASADLIRGFVTTPLEREIASADGIDYIQSTSAQNMSVITATLRLNYPPNDALTQVTSKVNKVRGELPKDVEDPVISVAVGETTAAMYINFASDTMSSNQITDYLTRVVQPKLSTVRGVQTADILGGRVFSMRIWLKPEKMAAYGLAPQQVRAALDSQNYLSAVGNTKGALITVGLNAQTDIRSVEEFKDIVLKEVKGQTVRLKDIANVELGAEDYNSSIKLGKKNSTMMAISALPTANVLDVAKRVREVFPEIVSQLPQGLAAKITYDSTEFINDSISEVIKTLVEAMLIVVVVIYLFLGSFRSVIIPIVTIPLSLIGGVFLMLLMGFTINLLTLLAMVLAIGLVVDDAIVVLENIHRHIEEGLKPYDAAIKGAGELIGPVISMTITLAAVYAPIGFQTGLTGALFKEFAFTLAGSVVISGVVALTLSPMMCSRILKPDTQAEGFAHKLDVLFDRLKGKYEQVLHSVLENRKSVYIIAVILLLAIGPLYIFSAKELAPSEDKGVVIAAVTAAPNATVEQTQLYTDALQEVQDAYPESQQHFAFVGMGGAMSSAFNVWVLKPWGQRQRSSQQLAALMQKDIANIAGVKGGAFVPPPLPGSGRGMPVQFVVCSTDTPQRVAEVADELLARAVKSGKFFFGDTDLHFDQPQSDIVIDREKAAAIGIPMKSLAADVGTMLGGGYVNRFAIEGRSYKVIPQVLRTARLNPADLKNYYVLSGSGKLVSLSTVASLKSSVQPRSLMRFQQLNAATISLLPATGVSIGDALEYLTAQTREVYPQGFTSDYGGELRQYVQEGSSLVGTFVLAIVAIYLVLSAQYESFRDPFVILMSVPLAITGALVFIFLGAATINIYTQVGLITLVGLISKHGILIVQFANQLREEGYGSREAIEEASGVRLRPILMTTAAMVLGVMPLLVASGAGAAARFSIGLVIATGMTLGTLFTLFVVPSFYMLVTGAEKRTAQDTRQTPEKI